MSSKRIEIPGKINQKGQIITHHKGLIEKWAGSNKGKDVQITMESRTENRSNPQNRYYWGVCIPLIRAAINDLGNEFSKLETHEFLKSKFNCKEVEIQDGHYIDVPLSTRKLDTIGFMDYITKIQRFSDEMLGIYIPDPDKDYSF